MQGFIRRAAGMFNKLLGEESGVTAIEYGLIAGAIAVAIIAVLLILGQDVANMFTTVSGALQQAGGA